MSGVFSKPKTPKIPPMIAESEPLQMVNEDADKARRREHKRLSGAGGRASTFLSGIQNALKKRLGE
jgi:hypothetical protein